MQYIVQLKQTEKDHMGIINYTNWYQDFGTIRLKGKSNLAKASLNLHVHY